MKNFLPILLLFIGSNITARESVQTVANDTTAANISIISEIEEIVPDSVLNNVVSAIGENLEAVSDSVDAKLEAIADEIPAQEADSDSVTNNIKSDVVTYLEKLALFTGDNALINDSIKAIIYSSITEYIMDVKDSSENPVSPANPNFLSLVFNEKNIDTNVNIPQRDYTGSNLNGITLNKNQTTSLNKSNSDKILDDAQQYVIANHPQNVKYTNSSMPKAPKSKKEKRDVSKNLVTINTPDKISNANIVTEAPPTPSPWKHSFLSSIQVSEAYISENWYQGGESNFNLVSDQLYNVEYDQNNILFTTAIQWKLGISTAPSDTVHKISINDDLFQINSKLGIKAIKDWYYTVSLLFKTQLFNSYPANSDEKSSAFFSPGELNVGVGISYNKKIAEKKFETSVMLAPLSYNLKFSLDEDLAAKAGIEDGKLYDNQVGSSFEGTFKWEFYPNLSWNTRVFYFTDYKSILGDIETGLNFAFNRFFSTRIYLQARYDDSVARNKHDNHLQFKEMLSFGFNYKFK